MEKRQLGTTIFFVNPIGLGCMGFSHAYGKATEKNSTPAQISLAWMLCKKNYIIPIPGSRNISRLKENFGAGKIFLSQNEISDIDKKIDTMDFEIFGGSQTK